MSKHNLRFLRNEVIGEGISGPAIVGKGLSGWQGVRQVFFWNHVRGICDGTCQSLQLVRLPVHCFYRRRCRKLGFRCVLKVPQTPRTVVIGSGSVPLADASRRAQESHRDRCRLQRQFLIQCGQTTPPPRSISDQS